MNALLWDHDDVTERWQLRKGGKVIAEVTDDAIHRTNPVTIATILLRQAGSVPPPLAGHVESSASRWPVIMNGPLEGQRHPAPAGGERLVAVSADGELLRYRMVKLAIAARDGAVTLWVAWVEGDPPPARKIAEHILSDAAREAVASLPPEARGPHG